MLLLTKTRQKLLLRPIILLALLCHRSTTMKAARRAKVGILGKTSGTLKKAMTREKFRVAEESFKQK